jgi:UME (NUC010) domain
VTKGRTLHKMYVVIRSLSQLDQRSCQGVAALKKVERALATGKSRTLPPVHLGTFLKTYMLGLISDINDMLQDVQGKKSVTVKRKILRSLGALVSEIGPAINNVAPQVLASGTYLHVGISPELDHGNVSDHGQHTRAIRGYNAELVQISYDLGFQRH